MVRDEIGERIGERKDARYCELVSDYWQDEHLRCDPFLISALLIRASDYFGQEDETYTISAAHDL